jgi:chromosome segregation ATPase
MVAEQIKKQGILIFLIVFLAALALFGLTRYVTLQKENRYLYNNLEQIKGQIDSLEIQRQKLLQAMEKQKQENSTIKDSLRVNEEKLVKMEADFILAKKTIDDLDTMVSSLKAENLNLKDYGENLKVQLSQVSQEKDALESKFNSLEAKFNSAEELKKAIRQIKSKKQHPKTVKAESSRENKASVTPVTKEGNRGFIIKNSKSTYPAKVIIEVKPASLQ